MPSYDLWGNLLDDDEETTPSDTPKNDDGEGVYSYYGNRLPLISNGYVEEGVAYFTNGEDVIFTMTGIGGGGSGGGGGNNAVLTVQNTSGWISKAISLGDQVGISFTWSSIENDMPTGAGTMTIKVGGVTKVSRTVQQGDVSVDISSMVATGVNSIRVSVADVYGNTKNLSFSVNVVSLVISSSFDDTVVYSSGFEFPYTPSGSGEKTVYFIIDGVTIGSAVTSMTGRQATYSIPAQPHGSHIIECYFTAEIGGEVVESNHVKFAFISVVQGDNTVVISSVYSDQTEVPQFSTLQIPFRVYSPSSLTTDITLKVDGVARSNRTVDNTEQIWAYRCDEKGSFVLTIEAGEVNKSFNITVIQSEIDVEAETANLALYLTSNGRSNSDSNRDDWSFDDISAELNNFNYVTNGWLSDGDGNTVLRVSNGANVVIPYQIFGRNFISTSQEGLSGKTIEIDFATRSVSDYNSVIISCWNGNRGIQITPQNAKLKSANTELNTLYKDNEHLRLSFVVEPLNMRLADKGDRLIYCYINGIMSRAVQYIADDNFEQPSPVGITIGSNDASVDIYTIRVYDKALTRYEVLTNWIADTQNIDEMLERYGRNQVYDNNVITTESLPSTLPYFILEAAELPQFKGDKKTISGSYVNREDSSKSFTFTNCQINVQGTSSAIYYRKNYDLQFKGGFDINGENASTYALRDGSIPFNRFVLKADVASSEGANNTELVMFYNDTCPYKTPEMVENSKVRWGIEGIPIGVFWHNTITDTTEFIGKYNFNLPKRAPEPYGYSGNDQSWEWQRNNSENVKFQDNDFTSQTWDEKEQKYYPTWYDDFEARFPSDEWRDYQKLNEFLSWVKSTWRDEATNETLPQNVTYILNTTATINPYTDDTSYTVTDEMEGGVATGNKIITFTKDTPAYRLTKFRAEFSDYAEIDSAVYYYLFTEMFLMIDSRAKNMFVGFHGSQINDSNRAMDRKAVFEPYDMDTAIGTNNSGVLMFGYHLEDTDKVSSIISGGEGGSDANVFNAQDSVLWQNVRDAFRAEINVMYDSLRTSANGWSYKIIENRFEAHQNKWAEAIFNEDAYIKYLTPLTNPVTVDETTGELIKTDRYLTMLQGSKTEQRKWWLWNRFKYMDSKFNTGDAANNTISMRLFNAGTLTITPSTDLYVAVRFGGGSTPQMARVSAGNSVSFTYAQSAQEMETWIYSADRITDVGDLSVFYPNECDFSKATMLERLKIGSSEEGYSNSHLNVLNVQNSIMLKYLDCRNCPNLTQAIDLSKCGSIEEVYFENTAITAIMLPNGGVLRTLHLPPTINTLRIENQPNLSDLSISNYSNISTLVLENFGEVINSFAIVKSMPAASRLRIIDFEWSIDTNEFADLADTLRTWKGVDATGGTTNLPQLKGKIRISGDVSTADISHFNYYYPDVELVYSSTKDSVLLTYFKSQPLTGKYGVMPYITEIRTGVGFNPYGSEIWLPNIVYIGTKIIGDRSGTSEASIGIGKQGDTDVVTLAGAYFGDTIVGSIYVPDDLVEDYKTATNWSAYSSKIYPLSEAPFTEWNGGVLE